jgi:HemY protein
MRRTIWILFLMAAAVLVALLARGSDGNVAVFLPPYRVDVSVNVALICLLAAFAAFYFALSLFGSARKLPERSRAYRAFKRQEQAVGGLAGAINALLEGRFARAEQLAGRATQESRIAGVASLIAARAASQMGERERTGKWLAQARATRQVDAAADVVQAEAMLDAREPALALQSVEQLHMRGARHVHTLRLKLRAATQLKRWEEVIRLTRQLEKHQALHETVAAKARADAYQALFERLSSDAYGLTALWQKIPAAEKTNPQVALYAAHAFNKAELGVQSKLVLEAALYAGWDERLIEAYAVCPETSAQGRIAQAERWLDRYPADAALLSTLGMLCMKDQLWGKAQQYLERSVAVKDSVRVHVLLAGLAEHSQADARALEHYKRAALLASE